MPSLPRSAAPAVPTPPCRNDANIQALLDSGAPVVTLVGKSSEMQVAEVLEVPLEENLAMIHESVSYLREQGKRVFFDAEHFFDGYVANPEYSLQCIRAAAEAGAEYVVLCDTNGGTLPVDVFATVSAVAKAVDCGIGIHCHNDADVAVANNHRSGAGRRDAGAGHHQRLRRAVREREPALRDPQPPAEAGYGRHQ